VIFLCLAVLAFCLLAAAWRDLVSYTIPNGLSICLALAGLAALALSGGGVMALVHQTEIALAVLAGGALLFFLRLWGAGDAKLLAALAVWTPLHSLTTLLIWITLGGGLLALLIVILRRLLPRNWLGLAVLSPSKGVPYGIAIAVGGFALILSARSVIADTFFPF